MCGCACALVFNSLITHGAVARATDPIQIPDPLPLSWCLDRANTANPSLEATFAEVNAARAGVGAAGRFEDPRFGYEAVNLPTGDFNFHSTPMSGHQLSLQYHEQKDEAFLVQSGQLELVLGQGDEQEVVTLGPHEGWHVPAKTVHRFRALTDCLMFEVSTPELEDVVRLEDDYGREGTTDAPS